MQGVSSALIARNESWVRQQAAAMMRRLPSNVEKADLIQVGLIAVAQAALSFEWPGDPDSADAREAFVRYARMRVKGSMIDELRQIDHLSRAQRRKIKAVQIARERWRSLHGVNPSLSELGRVCDMSVEEIAELEADALASQTESLSEDHEQFDRAPRPEAATPRDEVEARVDTAIVLRRLEKFFASLPERERQAIDAYLGIGLSPISLAESLHISPSQVSRLYDAACRRIAAHLGTDDRRAIGRDSPLREVPADALIAHREAQLAAADRSGAWGELIERTLNAPAARFDGVGPDGRISAGPQTRPD